MLSAGVPLGLAMEVAEQLLSMGQRDQVLAAHVVMTKGGSFVDFSPPAHVP